ncbi:tRNA(His) guanylyltransferase [Plasmodium coatneyi]|uniref:tRNA(His) guanylyltransferase n=1 Tax=Plasmodium coatneyi TaxID=208452 RepID=A0A1B1DU02_9APIC|nr:tRNA(His) guanylyltransferase [Plasmodium coatneyi]ANQ06232.1 tRNA(His) guanylyltransferase [Plasmodium coatneyi]
MANSKFAYVKQLEEERRVLPCCYFVVRIDGGNFKAFTKTHGYTKPNDVRGLHLMNACAKEVMHKFDEIDLAYGHSDEYSFLFRKKTKVWNRRHDKILTNVVSCFSGSFPFLWKEFFPEQELLYVPCFDGRIVLLPTEREAKDYFRWRQVDCHINTQYNECFWNLINRGGYSHQEAYNTLMTTQKKDKNELLFSRFGINYNELPEIFRRGSILMRAEQSGKRDNVTEQVDNTHVKNPKVLLPDEGMVPPPEELHNDSTTPCKRNTEEKFTLSHENLVSDIFWEKYHLLFAK